MPAAANAILFNSPALHALKRDQLVKLCKMHSIKANGKNAVLIERLKARAETLPRDDPLHFATRTEDLVNNLPIDDVSSTHETNLAAEDSSLAVPHAVTRPSEQWEMVMDSIAEEGDDSGSSAGDTLVSKGSKQTFKSSMSSSTLAGEFGTSKSSSTVGSLKAFASSLGLKKQAKPAQSDLLGGRETENSLFVQSRPYSSIPEASPSAKPQTDHFTVDPTLLFDPSTLTIDTEPIPGHVLRQGAPAPQNARLSLGLGPTTPSKPKGPSTTLRLVSNLGANRGTGAPDDISMTPKLKPYPTSFDLIMASPPAPIIFAEKEVPSISELPGAFPDALDANSTSQQASNIAQSSQPFIFGSPLPQHRVSDAQFKSAAHNVLEEMNKRLQGQGVDKVSSNLLSRLKQGAFDPNAVATKDENIETQKASAIAQKFDKIHDAHFSKMESIASSSLRAGAKRKSNVLESAEDGRTGRLPGVKIKIAEETSERRLSKRPRTSMDPSAEPDPEEVKRREAVKRKLEQNKARRRSSGVAGRPSMGRGIVKPQPKASRFGFLSSAAKSIVSSVWGRGKIGENPSAPKSGTSTAANRLQPGKLDSHKGPTRLPSATARQTPAVPPSSGTVESRKSSTKVPRPVAGSSGLRRESNPTSTVSSMGARVTPKTDGTFQGTESSRHARTSSRLMAPTASSLAKMATATSVRSRSSTASAAHTNSSILNTITNGHEVESHTTSLAKKPSLPPKPALVPKSAGVPVQRSISGRRPRISRGKVIAKLASQRAGTAGSGSSATPRVRSSLGTKQRRSMAPKARASGGVGVVVSPQMKKRARQSEYARRKSLAPVTRGV